MLVATQGLVLHTTPYAESSVVAKVFTRQLGVRSYIIKGVRGRTGRVKQNLLQPLSSLDMVVYDNHRKDINYIKELSPRHPQQPSEPVSNALRFFMTEVLYKALREEEPMQELWDYVESLELGERSSEFPIFFMLNVAHYMGIKPLDNYSRQSRYFCLEEGRYVAVPNETTLSESLSETLHRYLEETSEGTRRRHGEDTEETRRGHGEDTEETRRGHGEDTEWTRRKHGEDTEETRRGHGEDTEGTRSGYGGPLATSREERTYLVNALVAYFQMHLSGFHNFTSHEILHSVLR